MVISGILLGLLVIVTPVHGAVITVSNPNPASFSFFGTSFDSGNGLLIVGQLGEVFVFDGTTGSLLRTLVSPSPQPFVEFGRSMELLGDLLFVGAPGERVDGENITCGPLICGGGRVYVFNVRTGGLLDTLVSSDPQYFGEFGWALDARDNLLAVGAPGETGFLAGRVHVFDVRTGVETMTLVSPDPRGEGAFGSSIRISDGRIIVGEPGPFAEGFAGRAYIFNATTGALINTLAPPNDNYQSAFGISVAITNHLAFVGSPHETVNGFGISGRVYVFNVVTGALVETLTEPNVQVGGSFGIHIVSVDNSLIIGALDSLNTSAPGRVYFFDESTWTLTNTLVDPNTESGGAFGAFVDSANGRVYVGAPCQTVNGKQCAGAVYIFAGVK